MAQALGLVPQWRDGLSDGTRNPGRAGLDYLLRRLSGPCDFGGRIASGFGRENRKMMTAHDQQAENLRVRHDNQRRGLSQKAENPPSLRVMAGRGERPYQQA